MMRVDDNNNNIDIDINIENDNDNDIDNDRHSRNEINQIQIQYMHKYIELVEMKYLLEEKEPIDSRIKVHGINTYGICAVKKFEGNYYY